MRSLLAIPLIALGACGNLQRLSEVGSPPAMTAPSNPTEAPSFRPLSMPMPAQTDLSASANSLWRTGSRHFLRDQRAASVGDIVTVLVSISDNAELRNETARGRTSAENLGAPNLFGLEGSIRRRTDADPASLLSTEGESTHNGTGSIRRRESLTLRIAGVIVQALPNGTLFVVGRQEVRVNSELRELQISGVVRPQDIASDNTVRHDRLAEARIAYGGRGTLTDVQTPRYGQQVLDLILPF